MAAVEDHSVTSLGLQQIFADEPDITYPSHLESARSASAASRTPTSCCWICDPATTPTPQYNAEELLKAGVSGVVGKAASHGDLPDAVRTVHVGRHLVEPSVGRGDRRRW